MIAKMIQNELLNKMKMLPFRGKIGLIIAQARQLMNGKVIVMKLRPHMKIEAKGTGSVSFLGEDWLTAQQARMLARELGRYPYLKELEFEDEKGGSWSLKELEKLTEELAQELMTLLFILMAVLIRRANWPDSESSFIIHWEESGIV